MRRMTLKLVVLAMLVAIPRYGKAEADSPQAAPNLNLMTVAELEKAGDEARTQKDYLKAIDCFETAIRKDRKNATLYNKLGLTELRKDDLSAARINFEKAAKLNSK